MKYVKALKQIYLKCKYLKRSLFVIPKNPQCSLHRQECAQSRAVEPPITACGDSFTQEVNLGQYYVFLKVCQGIL